MISARLVRSRMRAAALPTLGVVGVLAMCAALYGETIERQAEREARAARVEHWATGPLRTERDLARLEQPEDRP